MVLILLEDEQKMYRRESVSRALVGLVTRRATVGFDCNSVKKSSSSAYVTSYPWPNFMINSVASGHDCAF